MLPETETVALLRLVAAFLLDGGMPAQ